MTTSGWCFIYITAIHIKSLKMIFCIFLTAVHSNTAVYFTLQRHLHSCHQLLFPTVTNVGGKMPFKNNEYKLKLVSMLTQYF